MAYTRKMAGKVPVLKQDLVFDATPTPGSENAVTSGGVAEAVGQQSSNIAESFSASSTYAIGEVVIGPDGKLYQCTTAVETAGEWDPEDWTETSMVDLIDQDMKNMEEMFLLMLPCAANTLRFSFSKLDYSPVVAGVGSSGTWKKVSKYAENNVWEWTKSGTSFSNAFEDAFADSDNLVSVIAAGDTSAITNMYHMFYGCSSLISVTLFDTSAATNMQSMFCNCTSLTSVPLFNTSAATNMSVMFQNCTSLKNAPLFDTSKVTLMYNIFYGCSKVEGGALALYQQASSQENPPDSHNNAFTDCGKDTTTGAAELAQIPASWGGTAAG